MQELDLTLKSMFQEAASRAIRAVTGFEVAGWLNVELTEVQGRRVDLLARLINGELLHIELQSTNDPAMAIRMAEYSLAIWRNQGKLPHQVLIYVGQARLRMPKELIGPGWNFLYRQIDIRTIDAESLLASPEVSDNVIGVLGQVADPAAMLRRVLARVSELGPDARARYLRALFVLAGFRGWDGVLEREIKMPIYIDPAGNTVLGREFRRGMIEGETAALRRLVEKRFGAIPGWVEQKLAQASLEKLEAWSLALLDADTIEEVFPD